MEKDDKIVVAKKSNSNINTDNINDALGLKVEKLINDGSSHRTIRYSLFDRLQQNKQALSSNDDKNSKRMSMEVSSKVLDILNANDERSDFSIEPRRRLSESIDQLPRKILDSPTPNESRKIINETTPRRRGSTGMVRSNSSESLNKSVHDNSSIRKKRNRLAQGLDDSIHSHDTMDSAEEKQKEQSGKGGNGSVKGSVKGEERSKSRKSDDDEERLMNSRLAFANADRKLESKVFTSLSVYNEAIIKEQGITRQVSFMDTLKFYANPISCDSPTYTSWNFLMIFLALLTAIYTPYRVSFETDTTTSYYPILEGFELCFDIVFIINMVLHACHFYRPSTISFDSNNGTFNLNMRFQIFIAYTSKSGGRRFLIDFISSLPWDNIASNSEPNNLSLKFGLGLLRTIRLVWVGEYFQKCEANVNLPFFALRVVKLLMFLLLESHWFACLFYFVGFTESDYTSSWLYYVEVTKQNGLPDRSIQRYLVSLYWSWVTCATLGYGDITPQTIREYIIVIFYTAFNILFSAYIVANMTSLVNNGSEETRIFRQKYDALTKFVKVNMIPEEISSAMKAHMLLQFSAADEHREILDEIPDHLKTRCQHFLYRPIIEAAIFSEFVSDTFIDNLSCAFKLEVVMPGNDIIVQDDASSAMYFIVSGSADTIHCSVSESPMDEVEDDFENVNIPKRKSLTDLLKSLDLESIRSIANQSRIKKYFINSLGIGSAIGEVSFFFNLLQPFSVRTSKISRLLILRKDDWLKLEPSYPIDTTLCKKSCFNNVMSQIKQFREPGYAFTNSAVIDREIMEIYNDLERDMFYAESQWEHDKIAELCLAAAADNIVVIKRILICGINVNSSDYDKRNPLMVASSKGSLNAVRYLLDKGADKSLLDVFGNSALYEAVRNGHDTCASILYENGARLSDSIDVYAAGSLLCTAISKGDHSGLMRLLQKSTAAGDLRSVKILLDNGADASCLDNFGRTPLLETVRASHNSAAKLLYDRGAQLGFLDTERENVKLERDILTSKADVTWKCRILTSSELVTCVSRLDASYLRMLLQFGANPNKAYDYDLRTPAHLAVCMNSVELCTILLEYKADFASDYSKDRWGNTPLDEAKKYGYTWLFDTITNLIKITNSEEIVDI